MTTRTASPIGRRSSSGRSSGGNGPARRALFWLLDFVAGYGYDPAAASPLTSPPSSYSPSSIGCVTYDVSLSGGLLTHATTVVGHEAAACLH